MILVIDERRDGNGDIFTQECNTEVEAIKEAQNQWEHLTDKEKAERTVYVLVNDATDFEDESALDGYVVYTPNY